MIKSNKVHILFPHNFRLSTNLVFGLYIHYIQKWKQLSSECYHLLMLHQLLLSYLEETAFQIFQHELAQKGTGPQLMLGPVQAHVKYQSQQKYLKNVLICSLTSDGASNSFTSSSTRPFEVSPLKFERMYRWKPTEIFKLQIKLV